MHFAGEICKHAGPCALSCLTWVCDLYEVQIPDQFGDQHFLVQLRSYQHKHKEHEFFHSSKKGKNSENSLPRVLVINNIIWQLELDGEQRITRHFLTITDFLIII